MATRSRRGCFRPLVVGQTRPRGCGLGSEGAISTARQGNIQKELGFWDYGLRGEGKQAPPRSTQPPGDPGPASSLGVCVSADSEAVTPGDTGRPVRPDS